VSHAGNSPQQGVDFGGKLVRRRAAGWRGGRDHGMDTALDFLVRGALT
jgi:hypothetical protein